MICIAALLVFGFLGLFSMKYRTYAKEAFSCVFRRIQLKPCDTDFDRKMKSKIVGKLMKRTKKGAKFVHKNFELISWAFTIVLFVSLIFTGLTVYNLAVHGTCTPENPDGCVFTPEGSVCDCPEGECVHNENPVLECTEPNCTCSGEQCST